MPGGPRFSLTITVTPNPTIVAQEFFAMAERADHLAEPLQEVIGLWGSELDANFAAGGRPEKWAPLAPATIAHRYAEHMRGVKQMIRETRPSGRGAQETPESESALAKFFLAEQLFAGRQQPLIDSGDLQAGAGDPNNWSVSGGNPAVAQMQDPTGYGLFHVTGRETPNFMPVRDWTFISDEALDEADSYIADYIVGG
jgi:hypothetical protein